MIQIFDTHAHYDDESFDDDRERLLAGFPAQGVHAVTNIGTNIRASEETVRMTEKYENLYGVVGIFPSEVAELENPDNVKRLKELAKHDKIVAIGEIGLDYHYEETDKALQHKWFAGQMDIVEALGIYLSAEGYQVTKAYNGQEACEKLKTGDVQLVLMDIMMPVMDGITAMNEIRKMSNVPVILLTAKSEDTDKILGLSVGADDYITKPFNPVVMIARVKAQLRRYMMLGGNVPKVPEADTLTIGGVCLDDRAKKVTIDGDMVNLTKTEYAILKFLMKHPNTVYAPKDIYRAVWEDAPFGQEGTVAVHIRHLREKIEADPSEPRYIKVVWGQGYMFGKE